MHIMSASRKNIDLCFIGFPRFFNAPFMVKGIGPKYRSKSTGLPAASRGFPGVQLRASNQPGTPMETAPIIQQLDNLQQRVEALRGYL